MNSNFTDLDTDWSDFESDADAYATEDGQAARPVPAAALHREMCDKCSGTGKFTSYYGRTVGACFACKGAGYKLFKSSADQRAKARESAAARKQRQAAEAFTAFAQDFPAEADWITRNSGSFEFAASMRDAVERFGSLTEGQLAAVRRGIDRESARVVQREDRAADQAERKLSFLEQYAGLVDFVEARAAAGKPFFKSLRASLQQYGSWTPNQIAAIERIRAEDERAATVVQQLHAEAIAIAVPTLFDVMQRHATFHAGELKISRRNGDSLCWLVWNDQTVGKIENARAVIWKKAGDARGRIDELLREFEANPLAAAVKYGRESGRCCSCGRDLTDPESVAAGIGPVCREKFGGFWHDVRRDPPRAAGGGSRDPHDRADAVRRGRGRSARLRRQPGAVADRDDRHVARDLQPAPVQGGRGQVLRRAAQDDGRRADVLDRDRDDAVQGRREEAQRAHRVRGLAVAPRDRQRGPRDVEHPPGRQRCVTSSTPACSAPRSARAWG